MSSHTMPIQCLALNSYRRYKLQVTINTHHVVIQLACRNINECCTSLHTNIEGTCMGFNLLIMTTKWQLMQ